MKPPFGGIQATMRAQSGGPTAFGWMLPGWALLGCAILGCTTSPAPAATRGIPSGAHRGAIAYGTADTTHTAVVAVLAPVGTTELEECTGTVVQVQSSKGYVLTAAHCCNTFTPTLVVAADDYSIGEEFIFGGTPVPPVYPVVAGSVFYDAQYQGMDHDFCMLQFSGATASTPAIALPSSNADGLALGSAVDHIGYGETETSDTNSTRRTGTDTVDDALTPLIIEFSQGGPNKVPGTCDGDSGGPSLFPAGVAQSQQVVVAVQSFGNASTCAQETIGVGSRVISEIGPGAFITSYLANSPVGVRAGADGGLAGDAGAAPVPAAGSWMLGALAALLLGLGGRVSAGSLPWQRLLTDGSVRDRCHGNDC